MTEDEQAKEYARKYGRPWFGGEPSIGDIDPLTGACRCGCGLRSREYDLKNKIK